MINTDRLSTIWRYSVPIDDRWHAFDLSGAVVHVASRQPDAVDFWALNSGGPQRVRRFRVFGTGHPLPDAATYVGTAPAGPFVWHLMEEER
jgi:hypothetical protein